VYAIEPTTWHARSIVIDPEGTCVSVKLLSGKVQVPGVSVPLSAMLIGQAKPRVDAGQKTACHVPTIMDWEQAWSFGPNLAVVSGSSATAAVTQNKIDATDTTARFNDI